MALTAEEKAFVDETRETMPRGFYEDANDEKLKFYIELVISDINVFPPATQYTIAGIAQIPDQLKPIIKFGANLFAQLFWQMKATLQDFSYNDQGLTVTVDQVGKIGQSYRSMLEVYRQQITWFKKTRITSVGYGGGVGLTTPRYQSQLGQFLKIALGSSFTWNSP